VGLPEEVGRRIAEIRVGRGWTQEDCAVRLRLTVRRLRRFEAGANLTLRTLERIADALGVSARSLLEPPASKKRAKPGRPPKSPPTPYAGPDRSPPAVLHERSERGPRPKRAR
jgi:transcriptional regulator with XRE-family HTH domain